MVFEIIFEWHRKCGISTCSTIKSQSLQTSAEECEIFVYIYSIEIFRILLPMSVFSNFLWSIMGIIQ